MRSLLLSSASGILLSSSVAQASPLLLLIILRFGFTNVCVDEITEIENGSRENGHFHEIALQCLSFLMLHIPDACKLISESLLDPCSILFTCSIEFYHDRSVVAAFVDVPDEPVTTSLLNIERQNSIQALCDAYGDRQKAIIIFHAVDCIKKVAATTNEHSGIIVQLIASLIDFMISGFGSSSTTACGSSITAFLCIELLINQSADFDPSSSFCLVAPVSSWLHALTSSHEVDWLAVSVACNLWTAAAASITSKFQSLISEHCGAGTSVGVLLEVATLALRRFVSLHPPEHVAADVIVARDSCSTAFRALSAATCFVNDSESYSSDFHENASSLIADCHESLPSHVRSGALLRLQNILLNQWHLFKFDLKAALLHAVHTSLFDSAASVYISAVEVLCSIGKVDPSSVFSFGSRFLSSNSSAIDVVSKDKSENAKNPPASSDLALCKVLDALGDAVRKLTLLYFSY
jgi:hypothetical protein